MYVVTVTVAAPTIVTMPSFAVPDESVYVGVPNEYPVGGGDGTAGSVTVHTVPVGIPLIVAEPPAGHVPVIAAEHAAVVVDRERARVAGQTTGQRLHESTPPLPADVVDRVVAAIGSLSNTAVETWIGAPRDARGAECRCQ